MLLEFFSLANYERPLLLWLYPFVIILLIFFIRKTYVKFSSGDEQTKFVSSKRNVRLATLIFRSVIFLLLVIALAGPFAMEETKVAGDPEIMLLIDNSTSFQLFDTTVSENLKSALTEKYPEIPVKTKVIASGEISDLGDKILDNLHGDDNILLVSDGNNNYGRNMGDMILFSTQLNSTINALQIKPDKNEASVAIRGPSTVIRDTKNTYEVVVQAVGEVNYEISLIVDDKIVMSESGSGSGTYPFEESFSLGNHKIEAKIVTNDFYAINNQYFKGVRAVEKPKVLFITTRQSPLLEMMSQLYETTKSSEIPDSVLDYDVVILDNVKVSDVDKKIDIITEGVDNGVGILVVGGRDAFDYKFKKSLFLSMTPVQTEEKVTETENDVNVVFVVDISGSTGDRTGSASSSSTVDVEKALAISILNDIRDNDQAGVIAFNKEAFVVQDLTSMKERDAMITKIKTLVNGGGTLSHTGLEAAEQMLKGKRGQKNIILISDGQDDYKQKSFVVAERLRKQGVILYTVGVGSRTNTAFMQELAKIGGSDLYFQIDETSKLKLIFGSNDDDPMKLNILNTKHFVTKGLNISGMLEGVNRVQAKGSASVILTTNDGSPVLTVWRYSVGKVAVLATDDGVDWGDELYKQENPRILSRLINWLVDSSSQNDDITLSSDDPRIGDDISVEIHSESEPQSSYLKFSQVGDNTYYASFKPGQVGFYEVLDSAVSVNYPLEYENIGMNQELKEIVEMSGGLTFDPEDIDAIVDKVKSDSKRTIYKKNYHILPMILAVMLLFLLEIALRRILQRASISDEERE